MKQMIPAAFEELINKQTDVFSVTFALCGLNIKYLICMYFINTPPSIYFECMFYFTSHY